MRAVIEILSVTAILLALFALLRMLWNKYIGKPTINRHVLIEDIKVSQAANDLFSIEVVYRLPVGGMVEIHLKSGGVAQAPALSKQHKAGYYSFTLADIVLEKDTKLCLKGPGTYLEKPVFGFVNRK